MEPIPKEGSRWDREWNRELATGWKDYFIGAGEGTRAGLTVLTYRLVDERFRPPAPFMAAVMVNKEGLPRGLVAFGMN